METTLPESVSQPTASFRTPLMRAFTAPADVQTFLRPSARQT